MRLFYLRDANKKVEIIKKSIEVECNSAGTAEMKHLKRTVSINRHIRIHVC